jgi:hypothetical protein
VTADINLRPYLYGDIVQPNESKVTPARIHGDLHLTDVDEDVIVAFLTTLSDGYFSRDTP